MQPKELNPFITFLGTDLRLDEAIVSSATFFLWERLYGVATASPTVDKLSLYCNQRMEEQRLTEDVKEDHASLQPSQSSSKVFPGVSLSSSNHVGLHSVIVSTNALSPQPQEESNRKKNHPMHTSPKLPQLQVSLRPRSACRTENDVVKEMDNASSDTTAPFFAFATPPPPPPPPSPPPPLPLPRLPSPQLPLDDMMNISEKRESFDNLVTSIPPPCCAVVEDVTAHSPLTYPDEMEGRGSSERLDPVEGRPSRISGTPFTVHSDTHHDRDSNSKSRNSVCLARFGSSSTSGIAPDPTRLTDTPPPQPAFEQRSQQALGTIGSETRRLADEEDEAYAPTPLKSLDAVITTAQDTYNNHMEEDYERSVVVEDVSLLSDGARDVFPESNSPIRNSPMRSSRGQPPLSIDRGSMILAPSPVIVEPRRKSRRYNPPTFYKATEEDEEKPKTKTVDLNSSDWTTPLSPHEHIKTTQSQQEGQTLFVGESVDGLVFSPKGPSRFESSTPVGSSSPVPAPQTMRATSAGDERRPLFASSCRSASSIYEDIGRKEHNVMGNPETDSSLIPTEVELHTTPPKHIKHGYEDGDDTSLRFHGDEKTEKREGRQSKDEKEEDLEKRESVTKIDPQHTTSSDRTAEKETEEKEEPHKNRGEEEEEEEEEEKEEELESEEAGVEVEEQNEEVTEPHMESVKLSKETPPPPPLSVSPSPSYMDYEWAARAQVVLEQQQQRYRGRTPSSSAPSTPPPVSQLLPTQMGEFDLPQLPKGRQLVIESTTDTMTNEQPEKAKPTRGGVQKHLPKRLPGRPPKRPRVSPEAVHLDTSPAPRTPTTTTRKRSSASASAVLAASKAVESAGKATTAKRGRRRLPTANTQSSATTTAEFLLPQTVKKPAKEAKRRKTAD